MRYRALDANSDMTFGAGASNYLQDSPATVAQAVLTALRLIAGEWFLDTTAGVPYPTEVLGNVVQTTADLAMKTAMLGVQGVNEILAYSSSITNRAISVNATLDTVYGAVEITGSFP